MSAAVSVLEFRRLASSPSLLATGCTTCGFTNTLNKRALILFYFHMHISTSEPYEMNEMCKQMNENNVSVSLFKHGNWLYIIRWKMYYAFASLKVLLIFVIKGKDKIQT